MKVCSSLAAKSLLITALLGPASVLAQVAPRVSITSPIGKIVLLEPGVLRATATASDADGAVRRVEFYLNGVPVGLADRVPYTLRLKPVPAGKYRLTARAIDNSGLSRTSAPVKVIVRHVVQFGDNFFSPAALRIKPAESVLFTRLEGTHTVTGTGAEAFCGSPPVQSCLVTFTNLGTFPYRCLFHSTPTAGMTGSVTVVDFLDGVPTVSLTSPTTGTQFTSRTPISFAATASDAEGSVTNVQFLVGKTVVGSDRSAPYSFMLTNLAAGKYTLSARAFDNRGQAQLSQPVLITVTP